MTRTRYSLALASAATLAALSCGGVVGAVAADPGGVPHHGDHGTGQASHGNNGHHGNPGSHGHGDNGHHGNPASHGHHGNPGTHGHGAGHDHAPGQQAGGAAGAAGVEQGDPPGNNGTVKIAGPGDAAGTPSNNPHPGCTFFVEWFGYDAGDDVVSTVTFTPQAPTSDITISGTSPSSVFVGGDAASGGTDLDGRQAYTLSFTGTPHPKQGYHVKLTVATPHSLGNDTKTKVFWVEPCAPAPATPSESPTEAAADAPTPTTSSDTSSPDDEASQDAGVLGITASASPDAAAAVAPDSARADSAAVPTAVDAGESSEVLPDWARSPIALIVAAGGLVLVAVAIARRARTGA